MRSRLIIALFLLIGLFFPMEYSSSGAQRQGTFPGGQFVLCASLSGRIPAWVQGLVDATGNMPYAAGGPANTGLIPVNIKFNER